MPIGTPTSIGSAQVFDGGSLTHVFTVSAAVSAGTKVVVGAVGANGAAITATFSDSKVNTWATDASNNATTSFVAIGSSQITNALTTSDTITVTYSASEAARMIAGVQVSGLATAAIDRTASATGSTVGWSAGPTSTLNNASELVISVCADDATAAETDTPGGSYVELFDFATSSALMMTMIYQIVSSTAAVTSSGTWTNSGSRTWGAAVATYQAAAAAPAPVRYDYSLFPKPKLVIPN